MSSGAKGRPRSRSGWIYIGVCLVILGSLLIGWLLTGKIIRVHDALALTFTYAQRGFGPTWQQIMCVKAWEKAAEKATC